MNSETCRHLYVQSETALQRSNNPVQSPFKHHKGHQNFCTCSLYFVAILMFILNIFKRKYSTVTFFPTITFSSILNPKIWFNLLTSSTQMSPVIGSWFLSPVETWTSHWTLCLAAEWNKTNESKQRVVHIQSDEVQSVWRCFQFASWRSALSLGGGGDDSSMYLQSEVTSNSSRCAVWNTSHPFTADKTQSDFRVSNRKTR